MKNYLDSIDSLDLSETDAACCALSDGCEAWLIRLDGEIHARILGGKDGTFLWQKTYRTVGWATKGLRAEAVRLGLSEEAARGRTLENGRLSRDTASDAGKQQDERTEIASAKSIWMQQCIWREGMMTRGTVNIPIVLESRNDRHEFRFTVGGHEFVADFASEREALERGVAKVQGLLDWAAV